jgi:hypothetical protein
LSFGRDGWDALLEFGGISNAIKALIFADNISDWIAPEGNRPIY